MCFLVITSPRPLMSSPLTVKILIHRPHWQLLPPTIRLEILSGTGQEMTQKSLLTFSHTRTRQAEKRGVPLHERSTETSPSECTDVCMKDACHLHHPLSPVEDQRLSSCGLLKLIGH